LGSKKRPPPIAAQVSLVVRLLAGPIVAGAIGALSGFVIWWPIALVAFTAPRWDAGYAAFRAFTDGAVFGFIFSVLAYLLFFLPYPPRAVLRVVPLLFLGATVGALPGLWLGIGALSTIPIAFLVACFFAKERVQRRVAEVPAVASDP